MHKEIRPIPQNLGVSEVFLHCGKVWLYQDNKTLHFYYFLQSAFNISFNILHKPRITRMGKENWRIRLTSQNQAYS